MTLRDHAHALGLAIAVDHAAEARRCAAALVPLMAEIERREGRDRAALRLLAALRGREFPGRARQALRLIRSAGWPATTSTKGPT